MSEPKINEELKIYKAKVTVITAASVTVAAEKLLDKETTVKIEAILRKYIPPTFTILYE